MSSNVGVGYNKTPFVCYFCNKEIHGETELGHTAVCGSVLIPCMNKCGVYTPRSELANHNTKCPNLRKTSNPLSFQLQQLDPVLKDSTSTLSSRNTMVTEIRSLQNRCSVLEQYLSKLSTFNKNKTFIDSKELERLILQSRLLEEWKDIVNLKLENIKQQLIQQELSKSEAQENWKKLRQYLLVFEKFKIDVSNLKENLTKEQIENRENYAKSNQNVTSLKEFMMERHIELESSIKTQTNNLEQVTASISGLQQSISEQTAKLTAMNFDVKALTRISTEAVEKLEIQEKNIEDLTKEMSQIKVNLEILEEKPETTNVLIGSRFLFTIFPKLSAGIFHFLSEVHVEKKESAPTNGLLLVFTYSRKLLWKITNVEARMIRAKENGLVLQSPIFFTHEFGYKIRGLLYLNGLNKWRDRYSLLCLQVMKGEYDMTLKWPCNIEGSVTLRDVQNHDEPKHFSKFISAKHQKPDQENEDPQESSSSYIFIPHRILQKPSHLKEDTIFIYLQINRCRESAKETNL